MHARRRLCLHAGLATTLAAWEGAAGATRPPGEVARSLPQARLVGAGRLRWFGFSVYDARLWARDTFEPARYAAHAFALELAYVRAVDGERIADRSIEEMRRLAAFDDGAAQRWRAQMLQAFPDVRDGDRLTGLHEPVGATRFFWNGRTTAQIDDPQFARLFFGIWLAEQTSQPDLRARLIGARS